MSIRCPNCDNDNLTIDFISAGYPVSDGVGGIDWETDESPTISGNPFCIECDKDFTIQEIEDYNSYCECGNSKLENSNFCKDCI
jgi:hypothetical protein